MDLQPLRIKEAVEGVIKMEAVNNGGTAIIERWDGVHPEDQIVIRIKGGKVGDIHTVGSNPKFPLELTIAKKVFLDHSDKGRLEFTYVLFRGGVNEFLSPPEFYSIELARKAF